VGVKDGFGWRRKAPEREKPTRRWKKGYKQ